MQTSVPDPVGVADPFDALMEKLQSGQREVVLSGQAGTGKTSLVKRLITGWDEAQSTLIAPTGRAARRLTEVTGTGANTIHSAMYGAPKETPDGEFLWEAPKPIGFVGGLVIIDEASMVGHSLANDLRGAIIPEAKIVWVGDPHQLPPVDDFAGVDLGSPDVLLTKVWRSSSGIMRLANAIVHTETPVQLSQVIQRAARGEFPGVGPALGWTPEAWRAAVHKRGADATLITYRNDRRHELNMAVRRVLGYADDDFVDGEPVVVRTNHKMFRLNNGDMLVKAGDFDEVDPDRPLNLAYVGFKDVCTGRFVRAYVDPQGFIQDTRDFRSSRREDLMAWRHKMRSKKEPLVNPKWIDQIKRMEEGEGNPNSLIGPVGETIHVQLGYALTCHCVAPDTLVETSQGLMPISTLPESGVVATPDGPLDYCNKVVNPSAPAFRLTTRNGYSVTVTPDHGMDTWSEPDGAFVRAVAAGLKVGSWLRLRLGTTVDATVLPTLPVPNLGDVRAKVWPVPSTMSLELAEWLGLFVADGTLFRTGFRLVKRHSDVVERFAELTRVLFQVSAEVAQSRNAHYKGPVYVCEVSSTHIVGWLRQLGGLTPKQKSVPDVVLRAPIQCHERFLRGLFVDGSVHLKGGRLDHIELYQAHPGLISMVKTMLLRMGIVSGTVQARGKVAVSNLAVYGGYAQVFASRVGFACAFHEEQAATAMARYPAGPYSVKEPLPISPAEVAVLDWSKFSGSVKSGVGNAKIRGTISKATLAEVSPNDERLGWHYDRVESIEVVEVPSMCVEVPEGHRFLQNGFAGWNSMQGSEADAVGIVWSDWWWIKKDFEAARAWWYTAVTRARKGVVLWT